MRDTVHYKIAALAIETGIAPQYLLELDEDMLKAFMAYFKDRSRRMEENAKGNRRAR